MMTKTCVFPDWVLNVPSMQMQSVLMLAARGPDNVRKFHPCKEIVIRYRATVLKAAYLGRQMNVDEYDDTSFMSLRRFSDDKQWHTLCDMFFDNVDELPHHYYMHLMHGAEIIGYLHPELIFRTRWSYFYNQCCYNLHLVPESELSLKIRLNDWDRKHWDVSDVGT
jgi:hypothetical protein